MTLGFSSIAQIVDGWVRQTFTDLAAAITTSYHTEHHANDSHAVVHADSYFERSRMVALGEWTAIPVDVSVVTGFGTMTVTVGTPLTLGYTLVGKTVTFVWFFDAVTIGGAVSPYVTIALPVGITPAHYAANAIGFLDDNGTRTPGVAFVQAPTTAGSLRVIFLGRIDLANWTASAGLTRIWGQLSFEVT